MAIATDASASSERGPESIDAMVVQPLGGWCALLRSTAIVMTVLACAAGCGGTLKTGVTKRPAAKPADDGTCTTGLSLCGSGDLAWCADLQSDAENCGACGRACSRGIACQAGACQQTVCQGDVPLSAAMLPYGPPGPVSLFYLGFLLADVDGDGYLDLVDWSGSLVRSQQGAFNVSVGQPDGGFAPAVTYQTQEDFTTILAGDIDGDGAAELFVTQSFDPSSPCIQQWDGHPFGPLTPAPTTSLDGCLRAIAVGDISGDGHADVVVATDIRESVIKVYLSDSSGALHLSRSYALTDQVEQILIKDWNDDGHQDLVVPMSSLQLFYGRGGGLFDETVDCGIGLPFTTGYSSVVISDFNHDGYQDLAIAGGWSVEVLLGAGGCRFAPVIPYEVRGGCSGLRATDMNGDGQLDLVALGNNTRLDILLGNADGGSESESSNSLTVLVGSPDGSFVAQEPPAALGSAIVADIEVAEVTGDGRPDVLVFGMDQQTRIAENQCP